MNEQLSFGYDGYVVESGLTTRNLGETANKLVQLKALSLKQPYANWVADGTKPLETRTWSTNYRGDILICASTTGQGEPSGVALCMVNLVNVRPMVEADEQAARVKLYPRAKAWELTNRRILKTPFPVKGRLGLFNIKVDEELLQL